MKRFARRRRWLLALAAAGCAACAPRPDQPVPPRSGASRAAMPTASTAQGVSGRVVDGAGRSVAGALIEARSLETPPRPLVEIGVLSGDDGRFRWPLPAGARAALRARLGDALSCEQAVAAGAADVVLTLPAPPEGCAPPP